VRHGDPGDEGKVNLPNGLRRVAPDDTLGPDARSLTMRLPEFLDERDGEVRLVGHRLSLFHLLEFYNEGYSAEMLLGQFPSLSMAEIHKVLAFYWENKAAVDAVLAETRQRLDALRAEGAHLDVAALRSRLASREGAGLSPAGPG
jgi:uncharacterized protein (DUF433 family)